MERTKQSKTKYVHNRDTVLYGQSWGDRDYSQRACCTKRVYNKHVPILIPKHEPTRRTYIGQDPTAPHLKYGVFKNTRVQYRASSKPSLPFHTDPQMPESRKKRKVTQTRSLEPQHMKECIVIKTIKRYKGQDSFPDSTTRLAVCASTHLDIKPRLIARNTSPPVCNKY